MTRGHGSLFGPFVRPCTLAAILLMLGFALGLLFMPARTKGPPGRGAELSAHDTQPARVILARVMKTNLLAYVVILAGSITVGLASVAHMLWIGAFISLILRGAFESGLTAWGFLARTLPHGVVEITGFILAASIGLRVFCPFVHYLRTGEFLDRTGWRGLIAVAALSFLLIFVAAFLEAFLTPAVVAACGK
ncbi:MAG: stage II sporulation protein M [Planctomycetota bacterium]|nr:stage II sporulation protein M [Planctomycetota bacterium]